MARARCLCGKVKLGGKYLVCLDCWNAMPSALRDAWNDAITMRARRIAAHPILKWALENRGAR